MLGGKIGCEERRPPQQGVSDSFRKCVAIASVEKEKSESERRKRGTVWTKEELRMLYGKSRLYKNACMEKAQRSRETSV